MATERVGDMTLEELKALIEQTVDQRLRRIRKPQSTRSVDEINESIRKHRWTPPPGAPSGLKILLDERQRRGENIRKEPAPTESKTRILLDQAQKMLGLVVGFGVILTIGGFWIVNTYLSQLTSVQTYLVHPSQILAAGIWFVVFAAIPTLILWALLYTISKYLPRVLDRLIYYMKWLKNRRKPVWEIKKNTLSTFEKIYIVFAILTFLVISFPSSFALDFYKAIPRAWGGGQPVPVILIFKDSKTAELLSLTPESSTQKQRTQPLLLLAELTDGVLVYDPQTERAAIVKNDDLLGRLEQNRIPLSSLPYRVTVSTSTP